jgi:BirA family biotin operon repressor/biotin-[acetyl-CoA-carboxylase] ligase
MKPREAPVLTLAAALAVAEAIEQVCDLNADIKWPNDLLLGGRKCCGILSEMHAEIDKIRSVVVGIGINVNHSGFPEALGQPATSLRIECKRVCSRVAVLCALLERFELLYEDLQQGRRAAVLRRWMARSSFAVGKCLALDLGNDRQIEGKTAGLSETGNLKIELADGRVEEFLSGEIVAWR